MSFSLFDFAAQVTLEELIQQVLAKFRVVVDLLVELEMSIDHVL